MDSKEVGEHISVLRKEKGINQIELAASLGVTNRAVSRWETGEGYPEITILPKLAKELGVSVDQILNGGVSTEKEAIVKGNNFFELWYILSSGLMILFFIASLSVAFIYENPVVGLIIMLSTSSVTAIGYLFIRVGCNFKDNISKNRLFIGSFTIYTALISAIILYLPLILFKKPIFTDTAGSIVPLLPVRIYANIAITFAIPFILPIITLVISFHHTIVFKSKMYLYTSVYAVFGISGGIMSAYWYSRVGLLVSVLMPVALGVTFALCNLLFKTKQKLPLKVIISSLFLGCIMCVMIWILLAMMIAYGNSIPIHLPGDTKIALILILPFLYVLFQVFLLLSVHVFKNKKTLIPIFLSLMFITIVSLVVIII